jgi:hypothetical protein
MTTSKASPAATRLAASTPPTDSISIATPAAWRYAAASSASSSRVAIDEMPLSGVPMPAFWQMRGGGPSHRPYY